MHPAILEPARLDLGERLVEQVCQRRSAPQRDGFLQIGERRLRLGPAPAQAALDEALELRQVELAVLHPERVARRVPDEPIRAEQRPQAGDIAVQRALRSRR